MNRHRSILSLPVVLLVLLTLALSACQPTSTEAMIHTGTYPGIRNLALTGSSGQQLLDRIAQRLNSAKALHGKFTLTLQGRAATGTIKLEQWSAQGGKSRNETLASTLPQVVAGSLTVSDGKKMWQYDPSQKVVYVGPAQQSSSILAVPGRGQVQLLLNTLLSVFGSSTGTIVSDKASVDGKAAYQVHVVPQESGNQGGSNTGSLSYQGEVYIDKNSEQPLRMDLTLASLGPVSMQFDAFELNAPIDSGKFTFVVPAGVKEEALPTASSSNSDLLSLAQAQKKVSYHLLAISGDHSEYILNGVTTLGTPKNAIYLLNYMQGSQVFTIAEGAPLANLEGAAGQSLNLRSTNATFAQINNLASLAWTEKGIGIRVTGHLTQDQATTIAQLLV